MLKNRLVLFATLLFCAFGFTGARAEEIGVVVWVKDGFASVGAFNQKAYEEELSQLAAAYPGLRIETLWLNGNKSTYANARKVFLAERLRPDDQIGLLVLATHGQVHFKTNTTELTNLGDFNAEGVKGPLKEILADFKGRFSKSLNIVLEACKAFCGTTDSVLERSRGLYSELASLGVEEIHAWGAKRSLLSGNYGQKAKTSLLHFIKEFNVKLLPVHLLNLAVHAYAGDLRTGLEFAAILGGFSHALAVPIYLMSGTEGYMVKVTAEGASLREVDFFARSQPRLCEEALGSRN